MALYVQRLFSILSFEQTQFNHDCLGDAPKCWVSYTFRPFSYLIAAGTVTFGQPEMLAHSSCCLCPKPLLWHLSYTETGMRRLVFQLGKRDT
uniref:Uncharacterized protein n=1 Tax=Pyxicephalus adspersus TaxID=30357 RepID=A0AAV3AGN1_PYXAD|nr:TPA: hypothetical protein GDO54_011892 [Pyxicephalus adspersus]